MKFLFFFLSFCIFKLLWTMKIQYREEDLNTGAFIWQGFQHKWQRSIFGFLTPHRVGSIENRIKNHSFNYNSTSADFLFKFTPGVNGDYAYPSTNFSIVFPKRKNYSNKVFLTSKISFNLIDEASRNSSFPHAETLYSENFEIPLKNYTSAEVIMNGFNIDMKCTDDSCNSNGIWPSKLTIDISNCKYDRGNLTRNCELIFELNRGWTPAKGGGKAFNYKMSYNVDLEILIIFSNESIYNYDRKIDISSDIHSNGIFTNQKIDLNKSNNSL